VAGARGVPRSVALFALRQETNQPLCAVKRERNACGGGEDGEKSNIRKLTGYIRQNIAGRASGYGEQFGVRFFSRFVGFTRPV